jgi:hypothetical protein
MNDPHGTLGRFRIPGSEIERVPDPAPVFAAPAIHYPLSLAAEGWRALATVVAMIGLSDLLIFLCWR